MLLKFSIFYSDFIVLLLDVMTVIIDFRSLSQVSHSYLQPVSLHLTGLQCVEGGVADLHNCAVMIQRPCGDLILVRRWFIGCAMVQSLRGDDLMVVQ